MKKLIHEIHRRSLWQVLGVYVVTGWVVLGAVGTLAESLNLPDWTPRFAFFLLIIGLPIVLATAFVQEGVGRGGATDVSSEDLETTAGGTPIPPAAAEPESTARQLFTWRNALVGGAAAFLILFGFAGLYVVIQDRGRSFVPAEAVAIETDPSVAFLPFSMSGESLEDIDLRESMVDLLPMALDGIDGIRPINSMTLWARWREHVPEATDADLEKALLVAEESGATYAVVGSGASIGTTVRLAGQVYDVLSRDPLGQLSVEGSPDSLLRLVDRFAVATIRTIGVLSEGELSRIDFTTVITESPEALKEFLRGEARYRRAEWATALIHFDRALEADSTFGAAHYRAGLTTGWVPAFQGKRDSIRLHLEAALRHAVSERVSIAIQGHLASNLSLPTTTEQLDGRVDDLLAAVQRYPNDAELWNAQGELYFHNHWRGTLAAPLVEAERALARAVALNPDASPDRAHLVQLAFWQADSALAWQRLEEFSRVASESDDDRVHRIMWRMVFAGRHSPEELEAAVDTLEDFGPLGDILQLYAAHPSAWPISEALIRRMKTKYSSWHDCLALGRALGAGRLGYMLEEALEADETWKTAWCLMQADFQGIEVPGVDSVLAVWNDSYWNAVHAADQEAWSEFAAAIDAHRESAVSAAAEGDSAEAERLTLWTPVLEAYGDWKQGHPERLAEAIEALPLGLRQDRDARWWLGMVYLELQRPTDAIRMFETFWGWRMWPIAKYRIGEAYEQLGDTENARLAYSEFVDAWKDADPGLEAWVQRGRDALARLGPLDQ